MNVKHEKIIKYRVIWTVVFGIEILFACGCSQLPTAPTVPIKQDRGLRLIQEGNIEEAIKYYDKAIELDPEQSSFYYNRGLARQMKKEFERALEDYSTAIRLDKEFISAYLNRGLVMYQLEELEEAVQDYNRVLELDPENVTAYNMRGRIRTDLGYFEEAILDFNSALDINPDHLISLSNRAYTHQCLDEFQSAVEDYTQLLQKDTNNAQAYNNRGTAKLKINDIQGALSDFDKAATIDSNYGKAFYNRAVVWMKLEDYKKAILDLEKAAELDENLKSKIQGHLKNCMARIGVSSEENKTIPQTDPIQTPKIQNEALVVSIEVPVRVFKNGKFADNLSMDDFLVYENGIPQEIESFYLIKKTNISRRELKTGLFNPKVASRHYVLVFEVVEYLPEIGDSLDYFFNSIFNPQDTLVVITPYKTYSLKSTAFERIPKHKILSQLKEKIRKDAWKGSARYRELLNEYQDLMFPYIPEQESHRHSILMEITRKFKQLKQFDTSKAEKFAEYLKDQEGQKHVFIFYQKEMFPIPPEETRDLFDITSQPQINTERIKQIFSDRSISCHFLFITKKSTENSSQPYFQRSDWYDMRPGTFEGMMALSEGTGGLAESSYDGREAFKKALNVSENYYILYYSPQNYQPDGRFREIEVKIKGKGYYIRHRAGYFAD